MNHTLLTDGWMLKQLAPTRELDAAVLDKAAQGDWAKDWLAVERMPATVHEILLAHGVIETPWLPGRAAACLWVAESDWVYATHFAVENPEGAYRLNLIGLDTIADVYLNGRRIAQHSNMLMPLEVDITDDIRRENVLVIHFRTVFDCSGEAPVPLDLVDGDPQRPVRRPFHNYGTYLGPNPYYSPVGVFDDIVLEAVGQGSIDKWVADAELDADFDRGVVTVEAEGLATGEVVRLEAQLLDPEGELVTAVSAPLAVSEGAWRARIGLCADAPQLWWPRGYGDQPLYRLEVDLLVDDEVVQSEARSVGFRRVTMPEMLHFCVNDVPVRLWGGGWVSPNWVTPVWDRQRVERLLDMAEHSHYNCLRVWGEAYRADDHLYQQADERGLLIWQDFYLMPLAEDDLSRAICREEAAYTIDRLKHHPSVFMWCGGNEAPLWHHAMFGGPGGEWPGRVAAEEDIAGVCEKLDPERFYLPNSPYYGIDPNDPQHGDTHGYTNVWFIPGYDDLVFASEDTRIAAPPLPSLERFFAPEDLWPADYSPVYTHGNEYPWPESWMPYTTAESWKKTGPVEQFYDATNPAELVYRLGMAEALYYRETIERQRRGRAGDDESERRHCGGYLLWKLADCWPQIYSGKVDYFFEPYLPYYTIRRAYQPLLVSIEMGVYIWAWVVNDTTAPVWGTLTVRLYDPQKDVVVQEVSRSVRVMPDESVPVMRLDQEGIGTFYRHYLLHACLRDDDGRELGRTIALADIERALVFPPARLDVQVRDDGALVIRTDRFARAISLEGDAGGSPFGWFFDDNWFDLLPGEEKVVRVLGEHDRGRITARAWYSPHATTIDWRR